MQPLVEKKKKRSAEGDNSTDAAKKKKKKQKVRRTHDRILANVCLTARLEVDVVLNICLFPSDWYDLSLDRILEQLEVCLMAWVWFAKASHWSAWSACLVCSSTMWNGAVTLDYAKRSQIRKGKHGCVRLHCIFATRLPRSKQFEYCEQHITSTAA